MHYVVKFNDIYIIKIISDYYKNDYKIILTWMTFACLRFAKILFDVNNNIVVSFKRVPRFYF